MKLVRRSIALLFLWLGSSVFISGLNRFAVAAEPDKINVCYSSIAATSITTWVPKEAGIYKKYGLDVSIIYVAGAQAITTLISGDTQIVQGSGAAAALSRLSGSDLTVIATTINVIPMSLVTTSDIATAQDLKGKTFGVSRFGSLTDLGLKRAVSELGLDPNKDIKMIQTGGVPENLLFLQQGLIKGALISSPTLERAKELGYKEFMNLANLKYRYPGTALVTTDAFIRNRPQTLNRFLKATLEGIKYAKQTPISPFGFWDSIHEHKVAGERIQKLRARLYSRCADSHASGNGSGHGRHRDANPKAKGVDPRQFYDPRLWNSWRRKVSSRNCIRASVLRVQGSSCSTCSRWTGGEGIIR